MSCRFWEFEKCDSISNIIHFYVTFHKYISPDGSFPGKRNESALERNKTVTLTVCKEIIRQPFSVVANKYIDMLRSM